MTTELKGKNIILRALKKSDVPSIFKYTKSPDIPRYTFVPSPNTTEHIETFIKKFHKFARKGTSYAFGITEPDADEVIGALGIHNVSAIHKKAEIGYWLAKKFRGRGIMPEAIGLALKFCFKELKLHRVQAPTLPDNDISQKLLISCGFKYEGRLRNYYRHHNRIKDAYMYAITVEDYKAMLRKKSTK